jgi:hypothetical protein
MTVSALTRVEELVTRRFELINRIPNEIDPAVIRSLKIELRIVSREAQRLVSSLTGKVDPGLLRDAINTGMK